MNDDQLQPAQEPVAAPAQRAVVADSATNDQASGSAADDRSMRMGVLQQISRLRLAQLGGAALVLFVAAQTIDSPFYTSWWFWVGLSAAFSATLLEPHFTAPRAAATNAIGGIAVFFTADRVAVEGAWWTYGAIAISVLLAATIVMFGPHLRGHSVLAWYAGRVGRARVFGISALLIESLRVASIDANDGVALLVATGVVLGVISLDWTRFLTPRAQRANVAVFEAAVDPNLLLFSCDVRLRPGQKVTVRRASRSLHGHVVGSLAHKRTGRYQVVLDGNWRRVLPEAGAECTITVSEDQDDTVGFVVEGTDELSARFHPLVDIDHGEAVAIEGRKGPVLFQVTSLKLERDRWDESAGLQPRAIATQIGALGNGVIALEPWLPAPFQPVVRPGEFAGVLPEGFVQIGWVSATKIPVGVRNAWGPNDGHVAILGMSGMGKTTAAQLLASAFRGHSFFVALDGTGEYRTKLGWSALPQDDWSTPGVWVHEPGGLPAARCKLAIKAMMEFASGEFENGTPARRVVLIEEAHSFLPEWNFSTREEQDHVHESARYILQSRKFGLSFVFVSQRTAVISKSALSQCENFLMLRAIDATSLDFIEGVVGRSFRDAIAGLRRYQALCVGPIFNTESPVIADLLPPASVPRSQPAHAGSGELRP